MADGASVADQVYMQSVGPFWWERFEEDGMSLVGADLGTDQSQALQVSINGREGSAHIKEKRTGCGLESHAWHLLEIAPGFL